LGGDGTLTSAKDFYVQHGVNVIGIPKTIDNDLGATEVTFGFDTAVNTAVQAIDKIRDTMDAHDRLFIVEVMGRDAGYIALHSGIATGAENILIPETKTDIEDLMDSLTEKGKRQKLVNLIVVAEGDDFGGANEVAKLIKERLPWADTRVCILGHIQRGGAPTCEDRLVASHMGYYAVESLIAGRHNVMIGLVNNKIHYTPLDGAVKQTQPIGLEWMKIVKILAS
jgi:6-phosphofructokinase 1